MNRVLKVYLNNTYVGDLVEKNGKNLDFAYSDTAESPISIAMPIQHEKYHNNVVKPFFENLLPEGDLLKAIASAYRVSENNPFSLLEVIGEDCAGAISLSKKMISDTLSLAKHLSANEFSQLLEKNSNSKIYYQKEMRLSLAGAQNKTTIIINENEYYIPNNTHPSTHIIKYDNKNYADILINEYFVTSLARLIKLPTSMINLNTLNQLKYLQIQRYDRLCNGTTVSRIHQEDFCQILSILSSNKYQSEGGVGLSKIVSILREYSKVYASDVVLLAKVVVFNLLIGNCDYHGKNLSMLHLGNNLYQLSPFYDLVSTIVYPNISRKNAMSINKKYAIDDINKNDIIKELNSWGIKGEQILSLIMSDFKQIVDYAKQLSVQPQFVSETNIVGKIIEFLELQYIKFS